MNMCTVGCCVLQRILYEEDELGVRLTEKEREIDMLVEERRHLNQSLTAAERELHAVQASISVKNQEISVSQADMKCVCVQQSVFHV